VIVRANLPSTCLLSGECEISDPSSRNIMLAHVNRINPTIPCSLQDSNGLQILSARESSLVLTNLFLLNDPVLHVTVSFICEA